ncbi:WD G-beta repeat containing protein, putative [Babesia ovis]|uniref:WD G-beta repeat containing protein, putative n=1 Tax=Babesia ovis TaxID=5869 RepID=A0A9W5WTF8_BABOV|nr:WD G-beta repeat containing protein, putative [Babesia ovis]
MFSTNIHHQAVIDKYFKKTVRSVRFSSDGEYLICASFDGTATIWSRKPREDIDSNGETTDSTPDPGVSRAISGKHIWVCVCVLEGHENEVKCAAFDSTGTYIATCGRDKTIWIHQRSSPGVDTDSSDISRLPHGSARSSLEFYCAAILTAHSQDVKCVTWSPTALVLASASYDNTIRLWGLLRQDWLCIQTINIHASTVWSLSFDLDGTRLAAVSADRALSVFESTKARDYISQLTDVQQQVACPSAMLKLGPIDTSFSHEMNRKTHVVMDYQLGHPLIAGTLCLPFGQTPPDDWQPCHFIQDYHSRPIYSVDFNTFILTGGGDNMVRVMSPGEGATRVRIEFLAHSSDINAVSWKPNDSSGIFVSVGDDEYIKLWQLVDA